MTLPTDLAAWEAQRGALRAALWGHLGKIPPLFTPEATITHDLPRQGYRLQRLTFDNGAGATVYGYLLLPDQLKTPAPAVLYHHFHGSKYDIGKNELFLDRFIDPPLAQAFTEAGYVVLAIDAYCFGERQSQGPAGEREMGNITEHSLFKKFLWEGSTLWGMMVRDDMLALNYLTTRPEVDPTRIATTGRSLGGSRATWLGALDDRLKLTLPMGQMTRYQNLLAAGDVALHSIYYYIPGVLGAGIDMEHIAALTAPRPQVVLIGDRDPLSPFNGVKTIEAYVQHVYNLYGAGEHYELGVFEGLGHQYSSPMYQAMMGALAKYL